MALFVSDKRYFLTADRKRAVPEEDPEAAFLLVGEGGTLPEEEAERYGLKLEAYRESTVLEREREGLQRALDQGLTEEARARQQRIAALEAEEDATKQRTASANKARTAAPEDKGR